MVAPAYQSVFENHFGPDWADLVENQNDGRRDRRPSMIESFGKHNVLLKNVLIAFYQGAYKAAGNRYERYDQRKDGHRVAFFRQTSSRSASHAEWHNISVGIYCSQIGTRLLKMVDNPDRPVQFVFAGKAHPQDNTAKTILQELMSIDHESSWQQRAVFIEDYDQEVARYLVQGVDVWMNVPRRPMEASGTSGMKAAMNGVLNFSILDGWWIEGYNEENGFAIGDESDSDEPDDQIDKRDALSLYETLENQVIPTFYGRDESGFPAKWVAMMKNSIATLTPEFSSDRMVNDYLRDIYNDA
jgi:starch phosphorylase